MIIGIQRQKKIEQSKTAQNKLKAQESYRLDL